MAAPLLWNPHFCLALSLMEFQHCVKMGAVQVDFSLGLMLPFPILASVFMRFYRAGMGNCVFVFIFFLTFVSHFGEGEINQENK